MQFKVLVPTLAAVVMVTAVLAGFSCAKFIAFDDGWEFARGNSPNPSSWKRVHLPHDYGWEDLPDRDSDPSTPVIAIRNGTWEFSETRGSNGKFDQAGKIHTVDSIEKRSCLHNVS